MILHMHAIEVTEADSDSNRFERTVTEEMLTKMGRAADFAAQETAVVVLDCTLKNAEGPAADTEILIHSSGSITVTQHVRVRHSHPVVMESTGYFTVESLRRAFEIATTDGAFDVFCPRENSALYLVETTRLESDDEVKEDCTLTDLIDENMDEIHQGDEFWLATADHACKVAAPEGVQP